MPTSYISVRTALSDFAPAKGEVGGQLEVKKGQILLLQDKYTPRPGWWKFKIKTDRQQNDGDSGLVPKANTQEAESTSVATACRDFEAQASGDLTITEHEALLVYCVEGDWVLVKGTRAAGYVPRECISIKLEEEMDQAITLIDYQATEPEELSFSKGETLIVLDGKHEHWWRCKNTSQQVGMVLCDHIELRNDSSLESISTEDATRQNPPRPDSPISSSTNASTIMLHLIAHGCKDLTSSINFDSFNEYPIAHSGVCDIYRGRLSDGTITAVKVTPLRWDSSEAPTRLKRTAARWLHTWSKCHHPNVLPLLGIASFRGTIGVLSPWMGEGSLPGYLARTPGVNRYKLCGQICEGLSYLHEVDFIHGDLTGSNILVSNEGVPLLGGFMNSRLANQSMAFTSSFGSTIRYTLRWTAPEVLNDEAKHTKNSDVYSLGMIIYEVIAGHIPFVELKSEVAVLLQVIRDHEVPKRPESITVGHTDTDKLWTMLLRCWSYTPASRPSASEVSETMSAIEILSSLSKKMDAQEVISRLIAHGCGDLSHRLDLLSFSEYPVSRGGFSDIYQGQLMDGKTVAVKVLQVSIDDLTVGSKHLKHAARELYTWSKCKHPNIMPLLGLAVFRDRIGMVAPWMKNGNLPRYLENVAGVNRYDMCAQICEGLLYLHQNGVVHCDLKGANVLVSDEGNPLLADFGISLVSDRTLRFTPTTSGLSYTLRWSPAELIEETGLHTKASDVYALGMTIYETMTGNVPYHGKKDLKVMLQITSKVLPERPECMPIGNQKSDQLWELLVQCWSYEPEARPTADVVASTMRGLV